MAEIYFVAIAVFRIIRANHPNGLLFLADGVETIENFPMGAISFVQRLLYLFGGSDDDEPKRRFLFPSVTGNMVYMDLILTLGSPSVPSSSPVPQVSSVSSLNSGFASSSLGGLGNRYSKGTGKNGDLPLSGSQQNARVRSRLRKIRVLTHLAERREPTEGNNFGLHHTRSLRAPPGGR